MYVPKELVPLLRQGLQNGQRSNNPFAIGPDLLRAHRQQTPQAGLSLHPLHYCSDCLRKQQEIDRLKEEIARLKDRLRYQERTAGRRPSAPPPRRPSGRSSPTAWRKTKRKRAGPNRAMPVAGRSPPAPLEVTRTQRVPGLQEMSGLRRPACPQRI